MAAESRPLVVIDANVAVMLADRDAFDDLAERVTILAPPLLRIEACSALHRSARRRSSDGARERDQYRRIVDAPIELVDGIDPNAPWDIATLLGWHKTYDAEYLAAARHRGAAILSFDEQVRSGARRLGIELART
jgi:predicted nucleic acid-binding protein